MEVQAAIEQRLQQMAAEIQLQIPGAEVRLFGSRARGEATPDSDIDLLITTSDDWLSAHDRLQVLSSLWGSLAHHRIPVDLLLYSQSHVAQKCGWSSHVIARALREGRLISRLTLKWTTTSASPPGIGCAPPDATTPWSCGRSTGCPLGANRLECLSFQVLPGIWAGWLPIHSPSRPRV